MKFRFIVWIYCLLLVAAGSDPNQCGNAQYSFDAGVLLFSGSGVLGPCIIINKDKVSKVVIGDGITRIVGEVFDSFINLASVDIPDSVVVIDDCAFQFCTNLVSITIPKSVTSIGSAAFRGCTKLQSITVSDENTAYKDINGALVTISGDTLVSYPCGATIYSIPNGVTSIGSRSFEACSNLASINIPNSVTSIEQGAFYNCINLVSIHIPSSVTSIASGVFAGCDNFKLVSYCGTENPRSWSYSMICKEGRTIAVPQEFQGTTFCDCPVTKTSYACNGCPTCKDEACGNIINSTTYTCSSCSPGHGLINDLCNECNDGEWSDGKMRCKSCNTTCKACDIRNGNCTKCSITSELVNGACNPCSNGLVSNGTMCIDPSGWSSVIAELDPEIDITIDILEEIKVTIERDTGYDIVISIVDRNTVKISIDSNDDSVLITIKDSLERCIKRQV